MAVISYSSVLLAEGSEAALAQHVLWGTSLVFLAIYGPGRFSADQLLPIKGFKGASIIPTLIPNEPHAQA